MSQGFTSTLLTLIPRKQYHESFVDFQHISVCNYSYKILAKILANRQNIVLPKLVSEEQSGIIQGRSMHENIALAQELIADIDKKVWEGNCIIKLDMSKAYDQVERDFLQVVLNKFGFCQFFCDMIQKCTINNWYSISFIRCTQGYFKSSRGLRQGDLMSPALFILTQEVLSIKLKVVITQKQIIPYQVTNSPQCISHLMYADDNLLFTNGATPL